MLYYVKDQDNKIVLYGPDKDELEETLLFMPQYAGCKVTRTYKNIVEFQENYYFDDDPEYLVLEAEYEAHRIQELMMTRSDFFDGTIKAWGVDGDDLLPIIEAMLNTGGIPEVTKKIAINNYKNALNFYRKHTLFTLLSNVPIQIGSVTVIVTPEQWDRFFDETSKRNPDAYKELLPPEE